MDIDFSSIEYSIWGHTAGCLFRNMNDVIKTDEEIPRQSSFLNTRRQLNSEKNGWTYAINLRTRGLPKKCIDRKGEVACMHGDVKTLLLFRRRGRGSGHGLLDSTVQKYQEPSETTNLIWLFISGLSVHSSRCFLKATVPPGGWGCIAIAGWPCNLYVTGRFLIACLRQKQEEGIGCSR